MGIIELFEVGIFHALWNWSSPILTLIVYSGFLTGMLIQFFFRKKHKPASSKWHFIYFCLASIVLCECVWHMFTGWERLTVDIAYGVVVCMILGALILELGYKMRKVKF